MATESGVPYLILRNYLNDGEWHKQKEITNATGLMGATVRQICQAHPDEFLGCVSSGYRLVKYATQGEIDHAINSLRSRARKILKRARALETGWNEHQRSLF
jgi:NADPH-dependent curcumin reductase CurA